MLHILERFGRVALDAVPSSVPIRLMVAADHHRMVFERAGGIKIREQSFRLPTLRILQKIGRAIGMSDSEVLAS